MTDRSVCGVMRKFIIAAILGAALTAPAAAEEAGDLCASLARLAHTYAQAKYAGVPLGEIMAIASQNSNPALVEVYRELALEAYSLPDYGTPEFQNRAMREHSNAVAVSCYRLMSE